MRLCVFALLIVGLALAEPHYSENDVVRRTQIVDHVNERQTTWKAHVNPNFAGKSFDYVKSLCGAKEGGPTLPQKNIVPANDIPTAFDSRTAWPECPSCKEVRDQGECGSCWAFGAAEAATDRVCIATGGKFAPRLSSEDLLSCCGFSCGSGCNGGYPSAAWNWFKSTGVVTGGGFEEFTWCRTYFTRKCDHHVEGQYPPCEGTKPTPKCVKACDDKTNYTTPYSSDKVIFQSSYSVSHKVDAIQTEMMTYGPVEGAFSVYEDFETYQGGVYQHTTGKYLGGHAIKVMGWGEDNGTPYWIVANSWNGDWGEQGYFRILRGSNECGIEGSIVAGQYKA